MSASDMIDAVVRDHVAPVMKSPGFKKTSRNWHRDLNHVVQVVNVQGSSWNDSNHARFTLNLGLWFPDAEQLAGDIQARNRRPPEYLCTVRARIGRLMPEDADVWWELNSFGDASRVGADVVSALTRYGLLWLESCSSPLDAFEYLRRREYVAHSPVTAFALAILADRRDLAQRAYDQWRAQPDRLKGGPIEEWAEAHGFA